jgi:hypothetical protein
MDILLIRYKKGEVMKKLLLILLTVGVVSGAYAQRGHFAGGGFYGGEGRTVIVGGYSPYYAYPRAYWGFGLGYPYLYPYYGYPYGPYGYGMSRLQGQIEGIKQDYADRIESVRMDNTITGKERRAQIRQLKKDRDAAIDQAKRDYWKTPSRTNTGTQPSNGSQSNTGNQPGTGTQSGTGTQPNGANQPSSENQTGSGNQPNNNQ